MSAPKQFTQYVPRSEEQQRIIAEAAEVHATGRSRAVFLYGRGGTGKTRLVRKLPEIGRDPDIIWLDPIDLDDSQHWLLSNLERHIADELDPDHQYFGPYLQYMSELPQHRRAPASRQAVIDHLNRIKSIFTQCYKDYINKTGNSVVITFDTIEAIRGMYFLRTLARWMKAMPGTLFVLAGRSLPGIGDWQDPIRTALENPPQGMRIAIVPLGEFNANDCREYLAPFSEEADLSEEQTEKLVYLTQGHPLWLAFTVDYLATVGLPEEADAPLDKIKLDLPYHGDATMAGRERAESFKRRLVTPYQGTDFWHEAIRRLAVVRESISQPIWCRLMSDRQLPADVTSQDDAWNKLRGIEWIRLRANNRFVTLHDAVAEELAQRIIDLHDADWQWRQDLWRRAAGIYGDQASKLRVDLTWKKLAVDSRLADLEEAKKYNPGPETTSEEAALIRDIAELDHWQQELNQLQAAHLSYQLLSDYREGAKQFVALLREASERHDVLFEDLLAFHLQRFLPGGADQSTLGDSVGAAIDRFRAWLPGDGRDSYVDIGLAMAAYLIEREQLNAALNLLDHLPVPPDPKRRYRLRNLQGNACMRIPRRVREGGSYFKDALAIASQLSSQDRYRFTSDAYKEQGFYYRNIGLWEQADAAYEKARDAFGQAPSAEDSNSDREEISSIYTNWAYVKGIGGRYDDGINLVESAITIRGRIGKRREQAISYGVKGEVYRYQRQFKEAWEAYAEAEDLFGETSWSWLGLIYQEQAICLFQSIPVGVQLLEPQKDPLKEAESLILESLNLCQVFNARAYPSALNRAGRIFGSRNPDRGLSYLQEAADRARDMSDGWFWLASLIEYAELCYRTWSDGQESRYLQLIPAIAEKLAEPEAAEIEFPELRGRWRVLQGHLAIHEALAGNNEMLGTALENYLIGFPLITHGWVGSYGASAIPGEFRKFSELAWKLPSEIRARWRRELYESWSEQEESATQLLARLEELY